VKVARLPLLGIRLFTALASMPVSTALVLKSIADAAEVQVALARRLDDLDGAVTVLVDTVERSARALEPGMVQLARLLDTDTVEQTVSALPPLLERLQARLDALQGSLPAFGQVFNPQTVGGVDELCSIGSPRWGRA
jgi:hypothetical protein